MASMLFVKILCVAMLSGCLAVASHPDTDAMDDDTSLLQVKSNLQVRSDACGCLNWKEVYSSKASCEAGKGFEFYSELQDGFLLWQAQEHDDTADRRCMYYYTKIDDNFCINRLLEAPETDTWCYVSDQCTDLNGGIAVPEVGLNAKICSPLENSHVRSLQEAEGMAQRFGMIDWVYLAKSTLPFDVFQRLVREAGYPPAVHPEMAWILHYQSLQPVPPTSKRKILKNQMVSGTGTADCSSLSSTTSMEPCRCLNWKEVYACKVECHANAGYEFFNEVSSSMQNFTLDLALQIDWQTLDRCANALEVIDDNFCVNQDLVNDDPGNTWCWVSSECTDLGGGKTVPEVGLSAKLCGTGERSSAHSKSDIENLVTRFGAPGWWPLATMLLDGGDLRKMVPTTMDPTHGSTVMYWNLSLSEMSQLSPVPRMYELAKRIPYGLF